MKKGLAHPLLDKKARGAEAQDTPFLGNAFESVFLKSSFESRSE
jgi:hypothetical protein